MKAITKLSYLILLFLLLGLNNVSGKSKINDFKIRPGRWLRNVKVNFDKGEKDYVVMQIYFPKGYKKGDKIRTLIALHDYDGNLRDWETNSSIERQADKYNMAIVCPNMRRTLYESKYYPETINKWASIPGGQFVGEVLLKFLQKNFNLAKGKKRTGILGFSTGGRGALLTAAHYNGKFSAAAGLSGIYDQSSMPKERHLISVYGEYKNFKDRWEKEDNVLQMASKFKNISVFIGHGGKDHRVPSGQSFVLSLKLKTLKKKYGGYDFVYHIKKKYHHDWKVWRLMLDPMMEFFDKNLKK